MNVCGAASDQRPPLLMIKLFGRRSVPIRGVWCPYYVWCEYCVRFYQSLIWWALKKKVLPELHRPTIHSSTETGWIPFNIVASTCDIPAVFHVLYVCHKLFSRVTMVTGMCHTWSRPAKPYLPVFRNTFQCVCLYFLGCVLHHRSNMVIYFIYWLDFPCMEIPAFIGHQICIIYTNSQNIAWWHGLYRHKFSTTCWQLQIPQRPRRNIRKVKLHRPSLVDAERPKWSKGFVINKITFDLYVYPVCVEKCDTNA